jgi:hypothetical protein
MTEAPDRIEVTPTMGTRTPASTPTHLRPSIVREPRHHDERRPPEHHERRTSLGQQRRRRVRVGGRTLGKLRRMNSWAEELEPS